MELRLGPFDRWEPNVIALYQAIVKTLTDAGMALILQLTHQSVLNDKFVLDPAHAPWNDAAGPFLHEYLDEASTLVKAFPKIMLWEIWNEPNNSAKDSFTRIEPPLYAPLLKQVYPAIKALSPKCTVILGGIFAHNINGVLSRDNSGSDYLAEVCQTLKLPPERPPFDAVGFHPYLDAGGHLAAVHLQAYLNSYYVEITVAQGRNVAQPLPIYITEAGWSTDAVVQDRNLSTLLQVCRANSFVSQNTSSTDAVAPYVAAVCWFDLQDKGGVRQYGLFDDKGAEKPSVLTYQQG